MNLAAIASFMALQTAPALSAETEACLRDNAVEVERASVSLNDAADFLIGYVCARSVVTDINTAQSRFYEDVFAMSSELRDEEPVSGQDDSEPSEEIQRLPRIQMHSGWEPLALNYVPVIIREAAGRYVLDARLARLEREGAE